MIGRTIADLQAGDSAELTRRVEPDDVESFVDAVGDHNPIHSDARFAAETPFGEPIAPGVFTAGLISAVIGTRLPGPGAIYLSQSLKFLKAVKFGDTITARVEVAEVIRDRNRIRLLTVCRNQRGEEVLTGEAWIMPSKTTIRYEQRDRTVAAAAVGVLALQPWTWAAQALDLWSRLGLSLLSAATSTTRR
jgi:acyl dehydratase